MELIDVISQLIGESVNAMQLTDMYVATVTSASPLEVQIDVNQATIKEPLLYRTDAVIERRIPYPRHRHSYSSSYTGYSLTGYAVTIDGETQPLVDDQIVLSKGLAVGDKVLLLAVQRGQKFIILSHLY